MRPRWSATQRPWLTLSTISASFGWVSWKRGDRLAELDPARRRSRAPPRSTRARRRRRRRRSRSGPRSGTPAAPRGPRPRAAGRRGQRARRRGSARDVTDARSEIFWWMSWVREARACRAARGSRGRRRRSRPDDGDVGDRAVGDPHLGAVEDPVVAVAARACVRIEPGSEPAVGLGQAEAADRLARGHRAAATRCFCSSEPQRQIANIASEPWTETSAAHARVAGLELHAGQAVGDRARARRSRSRRGACRAGRARRARAPARAAGSPCSNQSPMSGRTRSRTNCRTVSRIARSSSSRRASIARKSRGSSAA